MDAWIRIKRIPILQIEYDLLHKKEEVNFKFQ